MNKCKVDSWGNIRRRVARVMQVAGVFILLLSGAIALAYLLHTVSIAVADAAGLQKDFGPKVIALIFFAGLGCFLPFLAYELLHWVICVGEPKAEPCEHEWSGSGLKVSCAKCSAAVEIPDHWAVPAGYRR